MERDYESELSKLNIEQNACIYHFGASVIHGQRSNILRLPYDENYTAIGLSVKSDTLKFTSSQATYKLTYTVPDPLPELLGASGSLIAKISGENLVVTNTIY